MTDPSRDQQLLLLGQIHGIVQGLKDGQKVTNERLDSMDGRLRTVEQKAAVAGAVSGGAISIGIALIIEGARAWLRRDGAGG